MQREIFPTADLWRMGSQCPCSGYLRPVLIAHYEPLKSQATLRCEDCGEFWDAKFEMRNIPIEPRAEVPA